MMQDTKISQIEKAENTPIQRGQKLPRHNPIAEIHNFTRNPIPPTHKPHHVAQAQYNRATQALTNHGAVDSLEM